MPGPISNSFISYTTFKEFWNTSDTQAMVRFSFDFRSLTQIRRNRIQGVDPYRTILKKTKWSNFRIPRNSFTCHWIRIASIVLCLDLQSLPTHVSEAEMSCGVFWSLADQVFDFGLKLKAFQPIQCTMDKTALSKHRSYSWPLSWQICLTFLGSYS